MSERTTGIGAGGNPAGVVQSWRPLRVLVLATALALTDAAAFLVARIAFRHGRSVPEVVFLPSNAGMHRPIDVFLILGVAFIAARYVLGDYSRRRLFWDSARSTTLTLAILSVPCLLIVLMLPGQYSRMAELTSWTFLLFAIPVMRQGTRIAMAHLGLWRVPTALIASGSRARDVFTTLSTTLSLGCDIRWLGYDHDGCEIPESAWPLKRLQISDPNEFAALLVGDGCDQAVVATDDMQSPGFGRMVQSLMEAGLSVSFIPSFHKLPLVGVTASYFFGQDILLLQVRNTLERLPSRVAKRLFDFFGSMFLLIVLSPLFGLIAAGVKIHDGGPIIYRQKRTGRRGEPFFCLKFRTMAPDADQRLERWRRENPSLYEEFLKTFKLIDDPRITRPGKWLRSTSLDELPQLLNVLRGEMSLVGPRPVLERELIEYYGSAAQLYKRVRPGITGLWQIRGRSDTSYDERVVYDEWYILNWSFWYDVVILLQTIWVLLLRKGAY
jgi:Undecaprenyl-phosphate galactose phosphotransferase WbaP